MDVLGYILLVFVICSLLHPLVKNWWFDKRIRQIVSFDRICRLADVGLKDLRYQVIKSYTFSGNNKYGRSFLVQFYCRDPSTGHPYGYAGEPVHVDTLMVQASQSEEYVAADIRKIKQLAQSSSPT